MGDPPHPIHLPFTLPHPTLALASHLPILPSAQISLRTHPNHPNHPNHPVPPGLQSPIEGRGLPSKLLLLPGRMLLLPGRKSRPAFWLRYLQSITLVARGVSKRERYLKSNRKLVGLSGGAGSGQKRGMREEPAEQYGEQFTEKASMIASHLWHKGS